jgi:hypothetical protein
MINVVFVDYFVNDSSFPDLDSYPCLTKHLGYIDILQSKENDRLCYTSLGIKNVVSLDLFFFRRFV